MYNGTSQFDCAMHLLANVNAAEGTEAHKHSTQFHKTQCRQRVTKDQQYPRVLVDAFLGEVDLENKEQNSMRSKCM